MSDLAALVLLHLGCVLANCAVLASPGLKEPADCEDQCGQSAPNRGLRCGISYVMALEQLDDADDYECSHQNGKEALDPESGSHVHN